MAEIIETDSPDEYLEAVGDFVIGEIHARKLVEVLEHEGKTYLRWVAGSSREVGKAVIGAGLRVRLTSGEKKSDEGVDSPGAHG